MGSCKSVGSCMAQRTATMFNSTTQHTRCCCLIEARTALPVPACPPAFPTTQSFEVQLFSGCKAAFPSHVELQGP
jgi:hypothetical protein